MKLVLALLVGASVLAGCGSGGDKVENVNGDKPGMDAKPTPRNRDKGGGDSSR